ncbi:glycosyltransferase family 25 protein [Pseudomonas arcuscaelestis]|uniref:glycosyltransferase family 25 protein n=1 Tax=Pseudomonas arcuscaelestis TaxID=2710591 RepID=UPI00193E13AF|nr:glycosyltransferase family 25 protein [Pseudomonas arcuscaelestis]MBM3110247.1 glycosyltransferase family 25 protein [Pseudomonas arcuscaelestis]
MSKIKFDVDAVYCISLIERTDRRELFRKTLGRLLYNPVIFHVVERNQDPVKGCYESHQALAKKALEDRLERILIFEDDVKPYELKATPIRWINRFIRTRNFEALHLGYSMGRTWLTWFPFIARGKVVALHAYILSREGCQVLANTPYDGTPVDVVFKKRIKQHCAFPMLFRQHAGSDVGSDIEAVVRNEDEWWQRNWDKHRRSPVKNFWRTMLRLNF